MQKFWLLSLSLLTLAGCANNDAEPDKVLSSTDVKPLTDSLALAPRDAGLYYRRGLLLYSNNQSTYAEQDLRKAYELKKDETFALTLANLVRKRSAAEAVRFLEKAVRDLPQSAALKRALARGYQQQGQADKALALTKALLQRAPDDVDALALQAELLGTADGKGSLAALEKAHALVPSDPALAYDLAYEYARSRNSRVLRLTDSLLKTGTAEPEKAYYCRALFFENSGNLADAVRNYDAAIRANYNFQDAHLAKGQLQFSHRQYEAARKTFALALKIGPTTPEFYYWMGKAQEALGQKEEARFYYQRAYNLDKSMQEAKEAADRLSKSIPS